MLLYGREDQRCGVTRPVSLLCLLLGACTATTNVTPTPEENAARDAWGKCVMDQSCASMMATQIL
jgi:hypothetical protein